MVCFLSILLDANQRVLLHGDWLQAHLITVVICVFSSCSVCSWWMGSAPGEDQSAPRAGSGLLWHGVRRNRQGHCQRRPRDARSCENSQWISQPAGEDRVPQWSLGHEGVQLSPCGTTHTLRNVTMKVPQPSRWALLCSALSCAMLPYRHTVCLPQCLQMVGKTFFIKDHASLQWNWHLLCCWVVGRNRYQIYIIFKRVRELTAWQWFINAFSGLLPV